MVAGTGRLYRPELFEPLTETPWHEGTVRDSIAEIVDDAEQAFRGPQGLWPADPMPRADGRNRPDPMTSLYEGAAGTIYVLDELQRRGLAGTALPLTDMAVQALELFRHQPDFGETIVPLREPRDAALLAGETGILLLAWRLANAADRAELARRLERRIAQNDSNDADEVMWGIPGTLMAASAMLRWTGEERWRDVARRSAAVLLARRDADGLWTQRPNGEEVRRLDPIHGAAGNILALVRSLDGDARAALEREAAAVFARLAVTEHGLANWPVSAGEAPSLLRWCAGAPGIVVATADYLDEDLLRAGAELIWQAGAPRMASGPGICCGTAGNGYGLLKVFERTRDEQWLQRARRLAVHALAQVERDRTRGGPGWYSLWKGDLGVAVFAADCLDGRAQYPVFDGP